MLTRTTLRFDSPALEGLEWPCFEATGAREGPRLCLLAGVHGCEVSSIAAAVKVMRELDTEALTGSVVALPIVNPASFRERTPFVSPADGKNPNRCFPGDPEGTFTDQLAHHVFQGFIAPSDFLIDLHGGDLVEALEPFTIYDDSPVAATAHRMATAFGLRYVVRDEAPGEGGLQGTTTAAAAAVGIPAITPEHGGNGLLEATSVDALAAGVVNVLRELEMLPGAPEPPREAQELVREFLWLEATKGGWWAAEVRAGQRAAVGERLGAVLDLFGDEQEVVTAPQDGTVLFLTTSPAVRDDGLLLGLGAGITPL